MQSETVRPKVKSFHFCGHCVDTKKNRIVFSYRIEFSNCKALEFSETILLPRSSKRGDSEKFEKFLEPLDLILGISYYKLYCPPKIETSFRLSKEQADFWNTVYRKGLGEFLYRNNINPSRLAKFPYVKEKIQIIPVEINVSERALLGIGGGKDSIVAAGLLKHFDVAAFLLETQKKDPVSQRVIKELDLPNVLVRRILDPKIFELHEGAYNGHVPISAVYAFVGLFSAAVYGYRYVIVANESSCSVGNIEYCGETINHQWSKSMEFEALLQEYVRKFITPDIIYFSILRQFSGIRIVKMFAQEHQKFFPLFTSCNRNFKAFKNRPTSLWCGECPKCAFVFLMLVAFVPKKTLLSFFGKNMFADTSLVPMFRDLLGLGTMKPFDCVGTFEESQVAFFLSAKKYASDSVVQELLPKIKNKNMQAQVDRVFATSPAPTLSTPFRFLGIRSVGILGYGKEGKVTKTYLKKMYPNVRIGILDKKFDPTYLERQKEFDVIVKTPGIPKSRLMGNIGNPMLGVLLEKRDPNEIFVIELSSYMLEDIEYAPDIAVLLNLFPEHMDYHGGIEQYYASKKNIFTFQKHGDVALRPPFSSEEIPLEKTALPLVGIHNMKNIQAAVRTVRLLGVSDAAIRKALLCFKPLPHRLECVGVFAGIEFYDDAISTTPESTIVAIKTLKNIGTIFLGGSDRGYDFHTLEKILRQYRIENVVLFPESGGRILSSRKDFRVLETKSMEEAVAFAVRYTPKGTICLLSTASPSYSLWKNFEEKGRFFQRFVKQYPKERKE